MYVAAALGLLLVNFLTFVCFGVDKARARSGDRRVRESDLLVLAVVGGTPGALLGRKVFRHKTRKQPFSTQLMVIGALQIGTALGLLLF